MEKQKSDPILLFSAAVALLATVYVFYITVFEQIISQNQGYFYAVIFGFILLVLFLLCNLFTKLIAISVGEQHSAYRRLIVSIGLVVIAGLFLVTRMRFTTNLYPGDYPIYRGAVAMAEGTYSQNHDLIELANANPAQYLYSLVLSIVFRIVEPSAKPVVWVNGIFIVLCGYLTYKIVTKFTNSLCGLFAAILCAFTPSQTFAVYSFRSEPMVAAIFLGAVLSLIALYSYNKHVQEVDEDKREVAGIIYTVVGSILIGLLIFVEPFMIIPMALVVIVGYVAHRSKALNMLLAFAIGIVLMVILCLAKSAHMDVDFGTVMVSEMSAFDPATNQNTGQVSDFSDVYHSFNVELSSTDRNITENYTFIADSSGAGAYTEMTVSWVIVVNQIMYMFLLMMTISCMILAVKEQKDYVVAISMLIVGAVVMLLFQQNRDNQKFLFITVFIIASATGIHYLYLDHHPELKVGINALDALEKTGRKEIAAATRSNLRNAARMSETDFEKRAKALIFVGNDEELYHRIKEEEHQKAMDVAARRGVRQESFDDYDDDFFLDNEDAATDQVKVTTVTPDGIRQSIGDDAAYEPNAEMHESSSAAFSNPAIPAWKRPEQFGDEEMFDEDDVELGKAHSSFEGREALTANAGITTNEPAPEVEKVKRLTKKIDVAPTPKKKIEFTHDVPDITSEPYEDEVIPEPVVEVVSEPVSRGKKEKSAKVKKEKGGKAFASAATSTLAGGKAVRRVKSVGPGGAGAVQMVNAPVSKAKPAAASEPALEPAPGKPIHNPLPVPAKKPHKALDYDAPVKKTSDDDWDFDYDVDGDDDWDV